MDKEEQEIRKIIETSARPRETAIYLLIVILKIARQS